MRKRLVVTVFLLVSLLLAACGTQTNAAVETARPAAVTAETPTPVSPALTALLDQFRDSVHPGTAGASLRAAIAAAALLDWAENPPPQESIDATAADWLAAQAADTCSLLPEQCESLRGMIGQLTADYEGSLGLLDDAGLSGRGPWSGAAAQTALALLDRLEK